MFEFIKRVKNFLFPMKEYVIISKTVSTVNGQTPKNKDSKKYLEKLGFKRIKNSKIPGYYSAILSDEWRQEIDGANKIHFRNIGGTSQISSLLDGRIAIQSPEFTEY